MRVYEFAKQLSLAPKVILEALNAGGFEVKSHMTALGEKELAFLKEKFVQKSTTSVKKTSPSKKIAHAQEDKQKPIQQNSGRKEYADQERTLEPSRVERSLSEKNKIESHANIRSERVAHVVSQVPQLEVIAEPQTVAIFSNASGKPLSDVILTLLRWGIVTTKNQIITPDIIERLAIHYGIPFIQPMRTVTDQVTPKGVTKTTQDSKSVARAPVVVVLGHVDHGKTTLLDFIRKTRVAAKEKGGITQHLGAYVASTKQGDLVFLDTPGHEAFSKMRQRGVHAADIAVLVVAADDGVMPQTVEAIKHAKSIDVPIIVAINKIDKASPESVDTVKRQLSQHDVLVEDWGGSVVCVPISAKLGQGVDQLLDMIVLTAQLMDLKADLHGSADGYVLESRIEKGFGPVATLLLYRGKLAVGEPFVCGSTTGKVNVLIDSYGKRLREVGPVVPVRVGGFSQLPQAGDHFRAVTKEEQRRSAQQISAITEQPTTRRLVQGALNLLIKTDTNSTKEAILESIEKLAKKLKTDFNVVYAAVGDISESDVELAAITGARIIGLHVRPEGKALALAQQRKVAVLQYDIIYRFLEALEQMVQKVASEQVQLVKTKIGEARVLKVFDIKDIGVVAGSIVTDGRFSKDGHVVVWRGRQKVGEGKITSLQREKRTVKEVHAGFECGFIVESIRNWEPDDRVECYLNVPTA